MLEFGAAGTMVQAEMADTHKTIRQDMSKETADELHCGEGHQFFDAVVAVVEILEGDSIFANSHNTVIRDGDAEDVTSEILDQLFDAIERGLDIDFPIFGQGLLQHLLNIECAVVGIELAVRPKVGEFKTKAVAKLVGE